MWLGVATSTLALDSRLANPSPIVGAALSPLPWAPPPADSPELIPFLRNTSRPRLAYSTYIGWYEDGGLNETALFAQVQTMSENLRPYGWYTVLHDYGWQVCGSTYHLHPIRPVGCVHVDGYGRLFPSPLRYPSTIIPPRTQQAHAPANTTWGANWKPFVDKVHGRGIAFGLHLMHGVPKIAAASQLPILGTNYTCDQIVKQPLCETFIPDQWTIDATHPGAQPYYDSIISMWAEQGIDFVYFDGVVGDCGYCHIDEVALIASSLQRLGRGMFLFTSWGPPTASIGCPFDAMSELAAYVRVGADTIDSWESYVPGFSAYTQDVAPSVRPHHFGDLASMMVGKVHCDDIAARDRRYSSSKKQGENNDTRIAVAGGAGGACVPGPDYYIPSNQSRLTKDEVISYAGLVAIFRSSWWPSGVLTEIDAFELALITNEEVLRIAMMSSNNRQVIDSAGKSFAGPGIVWTADYYSEEGTSMSTISGSTSKKADWKYVLLVNMADKPMSVSVDFVELGMTPFTGCNVTDLWDTGAGASSTSTTGSAGSAVSAFAYAELKAVSLRSHASLLAKLSNCKVMPRPPPAPSPPPAPTPPAPPSFCPASDITACVKALTSPDTVAGQCSADFEHLQPHTLPTALPSATAAPPLLLPVLANANKNNDGNSNSNETIYIDSLYIDVKGTGHSDLHVVALLYADSGNGAPGALIARGVPVLLPSNATRAFLRLPFLKSKGGDGIPVTAGSKLWLGEQAGTPEGSPPPVPAGPNSLPCFGFSGATAQQHHQLPCKYTSQPFADGPKDPFGPSMQSGGSISIFASTQ